MNDKKLIIAGIVIFVVAVSFPFWFNLGKAAPAPELDTDRQSQGRQRLCHADRLHAGRTHAASRSLAAFGGAERQTDLCQRRRQRI